MQESESTFLLSDETVGDSITWTDGATELCKKVKAEEYDIHVVGTTNFYSRLQFFLLGSSWFPRPLGVCLWSALHVFLALYEALLLLFLIPIFFVLAILVDALMVYILVGTVLAIPFFLITCFLLICIVIVFFVLVWLWLVITCQCCTMPGRAPGQGWREYIFTAGGTLGQNEPQPVSVAEGGIELVAEGGVQPVADGGVQPVAEGGVQPVAEGGVEPAASDGAVPAEGRSSFPKVSWRDSFTVQFVSHVILVTFPYRRAQLKDLCREIVPWYDSILI